MGQIAGAAASGRASSSDGGSPTRRGICPYALLGAVVWTLLSVAKMLHPQMLGQYLEEALGTPEPVAGYLAWSTILGEALLGLLLLLFGFGLTRTWPVVVSIAVGVVALVIVFATGPGVTACGCFGAVAQATRGRRLVVAGCLTLLAVRAFVCAQRERRAETVGQR